MSGPLPGGTQTYLVALKFADLAATQSAVRSVTNRDDYVPAVLRLKEFIEAHKESPHAKPATGFGTDVLEAGKKLGEDIAKAWEILVTDSVQEAAGAIPDTAAVRPYATPSHESPDASRRIAPRIPSAVSGRNEASATAKATRSMFPSPP